MKQAILILAHKDVRHIMRIINCFDSDFYFFIHFDKKTRLSQDERDLLRKDTRVKLLIQKYKINWGGLNIVRSTLLLCGEALKYKEIEYLHLISGSDFPAKSCSYFKSFFEDNKAKLFLHNFSLPTPNWSGGGLNRLEYYYFADSFNIREVRGYNRVDKIIKFQMRFHIKRSVAKYLPLYGGSNWWSLNRECVEFVLANSCRRSGLLQRLRFTLISDEIYFQSVIMGSSYSSFVVNDNLRYIDWQERNGSVPACLDMTDLDKIVDSDKIFIRKVEYPISDELMNQIERICLDLPKDM